MPQGRPKRTREGLEDSSQFPATDDAPGAKQCAHPSVGSHPHSANAMSSGSSDSAQSLSSSTSFGVYVWAEVSMVLFYRFMKEIHGAAVDLASLAGDPAQQMSRLVALRENLLVVWAVGRAHLPEEERRSHDAPLRAFIEALVTNLASALTDPAEEGGAASDGNAALSTPQISATASPTTTGTARNEIVDTCRRLERVLEESGFPDDEGGDATSLAGGLAQLVADTRQQTELYGYSYNERTSLQLPLLPRYEGEKRAEEDYDHPRAGYVVTLPCPHPHPEVNTAIQLTEPKKRRTALDEFRIFSHPKKTTTHGVEDFMVDEELHHRAYVVLRRHLDAHGSLTGLSPYARFLLWNVVLDRDDIAFEKLYEQPATTLEARRRLEETRVAVGGRYEAFMAVRGAAREAAQRMGWYAASAQWRDQAISRLDDAEDADWYLLGDVARLGGRAVFPNYARASRVRALALSVLRKLDRAHTEERPVDRDEAVPVVPVAEALLLPLLLGQHSGLGDSMSSTCTVDEATTPSATAKLQRDRRRLRALMARRATTVVGADGVVVVSAAPQASPPPSAETADGRGVFAVLCPTMLFPLQCLAELLELSSLAQYAESGQETFGSRLVAAEWVDEEGLLRFLLQAEPLNPAIAPMVALPKVYRDLVTGIQLMSHDRMVPAVVEAVKLATERGLVHGRGRLYLYWKALSILFQEEERQDDLLLLAVPAAVEAASEDHLEVGLPQFVESVIERAMRVWPEDLEELVEEEAVYKAHNGTIPSPQ